MTSDVVDSNHLPVLVVPDPRSEMVPTGWFENYALPALSGTDRWEDLDEAEARLKAVASYVESFGVDGVEFEKALRLVEKRRGDLLDPSTSRGRAAMIPRTESFNVAPATASRYRDLARWWDDLLLPIVLAARNKAQVSQTHLLKLVAEAKPQPDQKLHGDESGTDWAMRHGDFRDRLSGIKRGSVDMILTDPPYPKDDLPLWSDLAQVASELLNKRGLLVAYTGQMFLPEVIERLSEHLTYGWTFALQLPGAGSRIMGRHIIQAWKPVLLFTQGTWPSGKWGDDWLISPERTKVEYEWQQNAIPAHRIIERLVPTHGLVVDPFAGVGSFGVAALKAGCQFVGVELDHKRYAKAVETIGSTTIS